MVMACACIGLCKGKLYEKWWQHRWLMFRVTQGLENPKWPVMACAWVVSGAILEPVVSLAAVPVACVLTNLGNCKSLE